MNDCQVERALEKDEAWKEAQKSIEPKRYQSEFELDMPISDHAVKQAFVVVSEKETAFLRNDYWQSALAIWSIKKGVDLGDDINVFNQELDFITSTKELLLQAGFLVITPSVIKETIQRKHLELMKEVYVRL